MQKRSKTLQTLFMYINEHINIFIYIYFVYNNENKYFYTYMNCIYKTLKLLLPQES